jgi:squalene-hopene/tetraprenyl-beta-curcumene cyclase
MLKTKAWEINMVPDAQGSRKQKEKVWISENTQKIYAPEDHPENSTSPIFYLSMKRLEEVISKARDRLLSIQYAEGYWVFDLEADSTITSEYIMLQRFLGREIDLKLKWRLGRYLLSKQLANGGWPLHDEDGLANISASTKAYFALKLLGHSYNAPPMVKARQMILGLGGAAKANVFTRISLALFGQIPWRTTPAMPVEIMLLPRWFFFHLNKVSYWSRTVIVPLLILYDNRPVCELKPGEDIMELFPGSPGEIGHLDTFVHSAWRKNLFILLDRMLKRFVRYVPGTVHQKALKHAEKWTLDHMQGEGGIGAIFPAMANAVMALKVLGYPEDHPDYVRGLKAIDELLLHCHEKRPELFHSSTEGMGLHPSFALKTESQTGPNQAIGGDKSFCQPCNSPIWDTCLILSALMEAGVSPDRSEISKCIKWIFSKQIHVKGDWAERVPDLESGCWAFEFENNLYPDLDDTAMVLMALLRAGAMERKGNKEKIFKAVNWVLGMQNSDGGWAAFDIDNRSLYLNDIPFADHGALLDPSTSDVTARCVEMLSMFGYPRNFPAIVRGIDFLRKEQEDNGAWYGRWGVNYIYGTWSVLCGLRQAGEIMSKPYIRRAVEWLKSCQNSDGGWGETCYSYEDPQLAGKGESTSSQTGWALLGLMAAGEVKSAAVQRGVRYLLNRQNGQGGWDEKHFTGTGFPRVFYLHYHGYSQYFPLWALSTYQKLRKAEKMSREQMKLKSPGILPAIV